MNLRIALALLACAALPYLRGYALPWISDDYLHLDLALDYGSPGGWLRLAEDALYRTRATSLLLASVTAKGLGLDHTVFQTLSIALHGLNTLLVAWLGRISWIGWRISIPAAAFFALHEIKQEAVLWHAALPELLVFTFTLLTVERFIAGRRYAAFGLYLLALLSKESAVAALPLLAVWLLFARVPFKRAMLLLAPFGLVTGIYAWSIFAASATHLHLNDGTFSLSAPFWIPWSATVLRMFWFWGVLALLVGWFFGWERRLLLAASLWIGVTLLPYSFLTYMPRIPSRHTYMASLGVAMIAGIAWTRLELSWPKKPLLVLATCVIVHNAGYVLLWKHAQFLQRTQPTETLIRFACGHPGPFQLEEFPYTREVAVSTLRLACGRPPNTWSWKSNGLGPAVSIDEQGRLYRQP